MMSNAQKTVLVSGGGLAAAMTAISLAKNLSVNWTILYETRSTETKSDLFYGTVTAPSAYEFLRSIDLDEPTLFQQTSTSFSLGTSYRNWPGGRSWIQGHQKPFPILDGVPLLHHLTRSGRSLEPLLVSAKAAGAGRFAHPPSDPKVALSRAEYGYQFDPSEWHALLEAQIETESKIKRVGAINEVQLNDGLLTKITLNTGESVNPDLVLACSQEARETLVQLGAHFVSDRQRVVMYDAEPMATLGPACRHVEALNNGWTSQTHLQGRQITLAVSNAGSTAEAMNCGALNKAWIGNCVAIGQAACVMEPLTPAPMMLLQRDIERLLDLIPVSSDMSVERQEFNRRFREDVRHTALFQNALYYTDDSATSGYWAESKALASSEALLRKINLFQSRGVLVRYDLEPFNDEDWTIAHLGMGRRPHQHDLQVERVSPAQSLVHIEAMERAIDDLIPRVPPHHIYVQNMKRYFEKQAYA